MEKIIIVAVADNNVIGAGGNIPWHSKEELQHFKNTTLGFPVVMGRKTFESIGKPLKGRLNIVITSKNPADFNFEDLMIAHSLQTAFKICEERNSEKVFVIGGGSVYREALPVCDRIIMTKMNLSVEGDTFFPAVDASVWSLEKEEKHGGFTVNFYIKKN